MGPDTSREFCEAARRLGMNVVELSASDMTFAQEFDAVFSNAALHSKCGGVEERVFCSLDANLSAARIRFFYLPPLDSGSGS